MAKGHNEIPSLDAGMAFQLHVGRHRPGASEFCCWAAPP